MQETTVTHGIIMENRASLRISGVTEVDRFDAREIRLFTKLGELTITGRDLAIHAISIETGSLTVEGDIWSLLYGDKDRQNALSFLRRIFR